MLDALGFGVKRLCEVLSKISNGNAILHRHPHTNLPSLGTHPWPGAHMLLPQQELPPAAHWKVPAQPKQVFPGAQMFWLQQKLPDRAHRKVPAHPTQSLPGAQIVWLQQKLPCATQLNVPAQPTQIFGAVQAGPQVLSVCCASKRTGTHSSLSSSSSVKAPTPGDTASMRTV